MHGQSAQPLRGGGIVCPAERQLAADFMADDSDPTDQVYASSWIAALSPFGPTQKTWVCPTIQSLMLNPDLTKPENVRVDYLASAFDDKPMTPHQWPRQPWFAEAGDVHGMGT